MCSDKSCLVVGILFNCASPESITMALKEIKANEELTELLKSRQVLLGAYANRLTPISEEWALEGSDGPQPMRADLGPQEYCDFVEPWVSDLNVQLIGGCCGMTPQHIAVLRERLET